MSPGNSNAACAHTRVVEVAGGWKCTYCGYTTISAPAPATVDMINHPPHYTAHPSGIECIEITEHMGFNLGNAVKYIWRADLKADAIEDLKKAVWYIKRELQKRGV